MTASIQHPPFTCITEEPYTVAAAMFSICNLEDFTKLASKAQTYQTSMLLCMTRSNRLKHTAGHCYVLRELSLDHIWRATHKVNM